MSHSLDLTNTATVYYFTVIINLVRLIMDWSIAPILLVIIGINVAHEVLFRQILNIIDMKVRIKLGRYMQPRELRENPLAKIFLLASIRAKEDLSHYCLKFCGQREWTCGNLRYPLKFKMLNSCYRKYIQEKD